LSPKEVTKVILKYHIIDEVKVIVDGIEEEEMTILRESISNH